MSRLSGFSHLDRELPEDRLGEGGPPTYSRASLEGTQSRRTPRAAGRAQSRAGWGCPAHLQTPGSSLAGKVEGLAGEQRDRAWRWEGHPDRPVRTSPTQVAAPQEEARTREQKGLCPLRV